MNKPRLTRTLLKQAIAHCEEKLVAWEGDKNPQIIERRIRVQGEKEAFEAVLAHLRGNSLFLNSYTGEY